MNLLGYKLVRYAVFEGEKNNRIEHQVRIEYIENQYEVYATGECASISEKNNLKIFLRRITFFCLNYNLVFCRIADR